MDNPLGRCIVYAGYTAMDHACTTWDTIIEHEYRYSAKMLLPNVAIAHKVINSLANQTYFIYLMLSDLGTLRTCISSYSSQQTAV